MPRQMLEKASRSSLWGGRLEVNGVDGRELAPGSVYGPSRLIAKSAVVSYRLGLSLDNLCPHRSMVEGTSLLLSMIMDPLYRVAGLLVPSS